MRPEKKPFHVIIYGEIRSSNDIFDQGISVGASLHLNTEDTLLTLAHAMIHVAERSNEQVDIVSILEQAKKL